MVLGIGSLVVAVLLAGYFLFTGYQRKEMFQGNDGATVVSVFAAVGSFLFGMIASQAFDLDLRELAGIAVVFAVLVGFVGSRLLGQPTVAIRGILLGALGAIVGTVLGSLFFRSNVVEVIFDLLFVGCVFLLQQWVERLSRKKPKKGKRAKGKVKRASNQGTIVLTVFVVVIAGVFLLQASQLPVGLIGQPKSQQVTPDEANDLQVAKIDVTGAGIAPQNTQLQSASMLKAIINVQQSAGSGLKLVSKGLNVSADLKAGENVFLLNNPQPGTYDIEVEPKGYRGTLTVVKAKKANGK
ncbi:MAG: hypothetical protein ACXVP5_09615 [Tumebacillaceae bacterium]